MNKTRCNLDRESGFAMDDFRLKPRPPRLLRWGIPARSAALMVAVSLWLPWCGDLRGVDLLRAEGLNRMWGFPAAGLLLLLLPFIPHLLARGVSVLITGLTLLAGAIYAGTSFRSLRGTGVDVAAAAGLLAMLDGILTVVWRIRNPDPEDL
ncbi:MAG: hypothetical protein D6761_01695 [Candidatus Dadabacteria bacterium]|nr:MAG: hypothetical protein D6761_01695 [Candidatus Dadabacteria bacterium]